MKLNLFAIAALSLAATLGAAQSQKAPARKADPKSAAKTAAAKTPEAKPAPAEATASPAAKDAPNDPSMSGDGRVTQVYTPKLPPPPPPPPLPAGAVQIEKNAWRATDKDGITYIYRRTPFGFSKYEASDVPAEEPVTGLTAIDKGDTVEFQRKTPFGLSKWTKPKAELDENETAALKQAAQSASKSAPGKAQE